MVLYTSVGLIIYVLFVLSRFKIISRWDFNLLNFLSIFFHFTFIFFFFYKILENKYFLISSIILYIGTMIFTFSSTYSKLFIEQVVNNIYTNISLMLFCIFYFFEIFKSMKPQNLLNEPIFWIVTGVFTGMGTSLPFYAMGSYFYRYNLNSQYTVITTIGSLGYAIMHIFFIKGFLCSLKIKNFGSLE